MTISDILMPGAILPTRTMDPGTGSIPPYRPPDAMPGAILPTRTMDPGTGSIPPYRPPDAMPGAILPTRTMDPGRTYAVGGRPMTPALMSWHMAQAGIPPASLAGLHPDWTAWLYGHLTGRPVSSAHSPLAALQLLLGGR